MTDKRDDVPAETRLMRPVLGRLTERERKFVEAFVGEAAGNATHAARIAGYGGGKDGHGWRARGAQVRGRARVRGAIDALQREVAAIQREADDRIRKEKLEEIARKRAEQLIGPVMLIVELQRWWAAIVMGELEGFDGGQRLAAARDLARSLGAFVHENEVPPPPQVNDGEAPRVRVQFLYVDNGRGPRADVIDAPALPSGEHS